MAKKITLMGIGSEGTGGETYVPDDATASDACNIATGTRDTDRWMVKVNGRAVDFDHPLENGDRVLVVPVKLTGN